MNKKIIYLFLNICLFIIKIFPEIVEVKLYPDNALVKEVQVIEAKSGINKIEFKNIPITVEKSSFTVKIEVPSEKIKAKILDIDLNKNFSTSKYKELNELKKELQKQKEELEKAVMTNERINLEKKALEFFSDNIKNVAKENLFKGTFVVKQWEEALSLYREKLVELDNLLFVNLKNIEKIKENIKILEERINQYPEDSLYNFEVVVTYEINKPSKIAINFIYFTTHVGWSPIYDIKYHSTERDKIFIDYYANIYQLTGVDWENIYLILSTYKPEVSLEVPEINPWELDFIKKESIRNIMKSSRKMEEEVEKESAILIDQNISVQASKLAVEYKIPYKVSIKSEKKSTKIVLASNISLKAQLKWIILPRFEEKAFLFAEVTNNTDFQFLQGEGNIYVDNAFIGKTFFDDITPNMNIKINLGKDLAVTSSLLLDLREKSKFFSKNRERRRYLITIKNNRNEDIDIIIKDIVPKSIQLDKINVKIIKIEPDTKNIDRGSIYIWDIKIRKNSEIKIIEEWEVEYSDDGQIIGL